MSVRGRPARVVLHVSFADFLGGAERSLLQLVSHLPPTGWTPVLACPPGGLADAAEAAGVRVVRVALRTAGPVSRRRGGRKTYSPTAAAGLVGATLANAGMLVRLCRRVRPDVLHSNSFSSQFAAGLAGRALRLPVLWHLREIVEPGPGRRVFDRSSRLATELVAISAAVASAVEHPRVTVVPNPVAPPPAIPAPAPGWSFQRPVVGFLGRLDPEKGLETLLDAVPSLPGSAVVVGEPFQGTEGYVAGLRRLAEEVAPGRVHFLGRTDDPWQALAGMDVLVVPSLAEPWGRVAAEGQLAGVPVVAADAGGLPEIVTDGGTGLLFPPRDADALARQVRRVLDEPGLRERLVTAGRASAGSYEPPAHARRMADVFARLAGQPRGPSA